MNYKRIVVPIDFSELSLATLKYAIDFAKTHRAEILLLHVIEPITHTRYIPDVKQLVEQQRADAAEHLAELENRTKRRIPGCRAEIRFGVPYEMISKAAKHYRADLIIMATHGFTGLHHLLVGSVAERVVRFASCPVLTVKPKSVQLSS
jgi:universal stress protein A